MARNGSQSPRAITRCRTSAVWLRRTHLREHPEGFMPSSMPAFQTYEDAIMLFMLDNYDSFTYNLVQYFEELGMPVTVARNDQCNIADIEALNPDYICLSPGPGNP